jgi:hypothetical protein
MTAVNFAIDSDFKWVLLAIAGSWAGSLGLFRLEGRGDPAARPGSLRRRHGTGSFAWGRWAFRIRYR